MDTLNNNNITVLYILIMGVVTFLMKLKSYYNISAKDKKSLSFLLLSPCQEFSTLKDAKPYSTSDVRELMLKLFLYATPLALFYYFRKDILVFENWILNSYIALIPFYLLTSVLGFIMQLSVIKDWGIIKSCHNQIFKSGNLSIFWGVSWNTYFSDWFRMQIFNIDKPVRSSLYVFLVSGLIHELIVNVPLLIVEKQFLIGSMMIYFLIQFVGIFIEKKAKLSKTLNQVLMWIIIVVPAPLVINIGTMKIFFFID